MNKDNFTSFDDMEFDDFADMLSDPLFWFIRWINGDAGETEDNRVRADQYRDDFRKKFPDEYHGTTLEDLFVAYAFGFNVMAEVMTKLESGTKEKQICILCGAEIDGFGNNPEPVASFDQGRCCDKCNRNLVIPARIKMAGEAMKE